MTLEETKDHIEAQRQTLLKAANKVLHPPLTHDDVAGIVYELDKAGFEIVKAQDEDAD